MKELVERHLKVESPIACFADHIQRQSLHRELKRQHHNLVGEVLNHQNSFRRLATILQIHEQHSAVNETVSEQIEQCINALIEVNEKKTAG